MKYALLLLCLASSFSALSQATTSNFSISGRVSFVVEQDTVPEKEALVTMQTSRWVELTDSAGAFSFKNVKPGTYHLKVVGNSFKEIDMTLVIADKSVTNLHLLAVSTCDVNAAVATRDILDKKPRFLLASGIAPQAFSNKENFNRRFKVDYYDFGCNVPNEQCIIRYNQVVIKYLDETYGRQWRDDVRKDVLGL